MKVDGIKLQVQWQLPRNILDTGFAFFFFAFLLSPIVKTDLPCFELGNISLDVGPTASRVQLSGEEKQERKKEKKNGRRESDIVPGVKQGREGN